MSLDAIVSRTSPATPDTTARRVVEGYLRGCPLIDTADIQRMAQDIVQQASDTCHSFATANATQLCKLSLRLASQRLAETLPSGTGWVVPRETPSRMSPAEPVRPAVAIRLGGWRDALRLAVAR